ncbi:MAG TPA: hypothetical protein VE172_14650 [Stackebrandtia sp.]|jgi:hypothetical protein|uniref:hypothetical protein n=1 Tax=Stackebrandtia sp. TaxID=2023065 RepID=UPI002D55BD17|nr:hypothetical protein [Stackebrandtia sp.]HZE40043.1 hypothetical protein [Stackebrandtia sp.]
MTTIEVPIALRDQLVRRACRDRVTIAEEIARCVAAAEELEFWREVRRTMVGPASRSERGSLEVDRTARDGLEPEDWSDVL